MRILLVNDFGMRVGGAEHYMFMLRDALRKAGHEALVLSSDYRRAPGDFESDFQVPASGHLYNLDSLFNPRSYLGIRRVLAKYDPAVVHFHNVFYTLSPSVLFAVKRRRTVLTLHDYFSICLTDKTQCRGVACSNALATCEGCAPNIQRRSFELFRRGCSRAGLARIQTLIAPSEYTAAEYQRNGIRSRVLVHPIEGESHVRTVTNRTPKELVYVGRLAPQKGVDCALRALALLRAKGALVHLHILGDGPQRAELETLAEELGISEKVSFLGWCSPEVRDQYLARTDILLQPALWPEVAGLTVLEAARFGVVPVVSRIGALAETVREGVNGLLVTPDSPEALAAAILSLIESPDTYAALSRGISSAGATRDLESHCQELLRVYDSY